MTGPSRILSLYVACLLLAACSSFSTDFDYDTTAEFSRLQTYQWLASAASDTPQELVHRRAVEAVNEGLAAKGYRQVEQGPDFRVAVHFGSRERVQVTDWGYGYGHPGRYYGGGVDVYTYTEGSMVLDVVDARSNELLWRGSATGVVRKSATPEERTARVREVVAALLAEFPPGTGG